MGLFDFLGKKRTAAPPSGKPLCDAMTSVAISDNQQTRAALYETLLKSWLYVPTPELPPEMKKGGTTLHMGARVQFTHVKDGEGRVIFPAFTDDEALRNWDPNTPSFALPAQDYFRTVVELKVEEVRINLYDPIRKPIRPGGSLRKRELEALAHGQLPPSTESEMKFKSGQQVMIGRPANPLSDAVQLKLKDACSRLHLVRRAFYAMMAIPPEAPTHTVALVFSEEATESQKRDCFELLMLQTKADFPGDILITMLEAKGSMAETFRANGVEIFNRQ